jgi:large subunit ribosomal protein L21
MYAVVEVQGKQYRAEKGKTIRVDKIEAEKGSKIDFDSVLLVSGDTIKIGSPYVAGASVKAIVADHAKADKVIVFKYKAKKDYRRKYGHRQNYTLLTIEEIAGA